MSLHSKLVANTPKMLSALTGIAGTVVVVQGLSFLANLLVIRTLSVTDYAILTSSLSILGVLGGLADSGLAQAALTVGGMHHESSKEKSQVLGRCRFLILRTGLAAAVLIVPLWLFMVQRLGGSPGQVLGISVVLFGGFFVTLGLNIFKSFLLLEGRRVVLQKIDVIKTLVRVLLLFGGIWLFPNAAFVIACGSAVEAGAWWYCRHQLGHLTSAEARPSEDIKRELGSIFWRLMPASIYRAASSQLFLLLLVAFGSTGGVAGAGALSRFLQFYIIVSSLSATIFAPRLARATDRQERNRKFMIYTVCGWMAAVTVCLGVAAVATPVLQWFGASYADLVVELRVFMVAGCMGAMNGVLAGLLNTRGWVMPPALLIGGDVMFTIVAIGVCDVATLWGFVAMNLVVNSANLAVAVLWAVFCILTRRSNEVAMTNVDDDYEQ